MPKTLKKKITKKPKKVAKKVVAKKAPKKKKKLSKKDQEDLFCNNYIIHFNATQSAKDAGYSIKSARELGYRLLRNVHIQVKIKQLIDKRTDRLEVSQDRVVHELMAVAFSDIKNYLTDEGAIDFKELKDSDSNVVKSYEENTTVTDGEKFSNTKIVKKFQLHDKMKALELLGKHLAMYTDKKELDHKGLVIVTPEIKEMMDKAGD